MSLYEYYNQAFKIRVSFTKLLLRDFGIKDKIRNVEIPGMRGGISEEDAKILNAIADQYDIKHPILAKYPSWLVDTLRTSVLTLLRDLIHNIRSAMAIEVIHEKDYWLYREYQNRAIGCCKNLLEEMEYVIQVIPCDVTKFAPYVEMIKKEIEHLREWMKTGSKRLLDVKK